MTQQVPPPGRRHGPPPGAPGLPPRPPFSPGPRGGPSGQGPTGPGPTGPGPTGPVPRPPVASFGDAFVGPPQPNRLALVALVLAVVVPVVGLVLGVVVRRRITGRTAAGKGLATAAIVVGGVLTTLVVAAVVLVPLLAPDVSRLLTRDLPPTTVAETIATSAGYPAGSVTCPEALPATVAATTVCSVAVPDQPTAVRATVTSVDGGQVLFDVVPE